MPATACTKPPAVRVGIKTRVGQPRALVLTAGQHRRHSGRVDHHNNVSPIRERKRDEREQLCSAPCKAHRVAIQGSPASPQPRTNSNINVDSLSMGRMACLIDCHTTCLAPGYTTLMHCSQSWHLSFYLCKAVGCPNRSPLSKHRPDFD